VLPAADARIGNVARLSTQLDYLAADVAHPLLDGLEAAAHRLRVGTPSLTQAQSLALARRVTCECEGGVRWRWDPRLGTRAGVAFGVDGLGRSAYLEVLRSITAPTALVYGDRSDHCPESDRELAKDVLRGAQSIVLPGGHQLHHDAPAGLAEVIGAVVRGVAVGSAERGLRGEDALHAV
jgi:pimeloyl-ACP methyl ester carboxylesterase